MRVSDELMSKPDLLSLRDRWITCPFSLTRKAPGTTRKLPPTVGWSLNFLRPVPHRRRPPWSRPRQQQPPRAAITPSDCRTPSLTDSSAGAPRAPSHGHRGTALGPGVCTLVLQLALPAPDARGSHRGSGCSGTTRREGRGPSPAAAPSTPRRRSCPPAAGAAPGCPTGPLEGGRGQRQSEWGEGASQPADGSENERQAKAAGPALRRGVRPLAWHWIRCHGGATANTAVPLVQRA